MSRNMCADEEYPNQMCSLSFAVCDFGCELCTDLQAFYKSDMFMLQAKVYNASQQSLLPFPG